MIRRLIGASFAAALAVAAVPSVAADAYTFDKNHSRIAFTWNHVGLSNQSARFGSFDGEYSFFKFSSIETILFFLLLTAILLPAVSGRLVIRQKSRQ